MHIACAPCLDGLGQRFPNMVTKQSQSAFALAILLLLQGAFITTCEATSAPSAPAVPAAAGAVKPSVISAAAARQQQSKASSGLTAESGHQLLEEGLSIDSIAAEAAARPALAEPSQYAVKGVIDPQAPLFSKEPGILVPLAQGGSSVGDWLAAVEAAGPSTPLADPMFMGTVFIPYNEAFEELYPEMRLLKLAGKSAGDFLSNASTTDLALQLNCLTVPGAALKLDEMWPGRLLRTAGFGALKVISNSGAEKPARLQHQPSGIYFSVVEPDLQSGSAVAHVIDVLPPATVLNKVAASAADMQGAWQYRSVLMALTDPVRHLQAFALLVQRAALNGLMESSSDAFTLFAPDEKAMAALMASLPVHTRQQLLSNATLADAFVSSHLVLGTALGSKALEALAPAGLLKSPQGNLAVTIAAGEHPSAQLPTGAVAIIEAGQQLPEGTSLLPTPTEEPATPAAAPIADPSATSPSTAAAGSSGLAAPAGSGTEAPAAAAAAAPGQSHSLTAADVVVSDGPTAEAVGLGTPEAAAAARSRVLRVADASVISNDMVGGKAVLHVVDRVLISPTLSQELGLPPNPGYAELEALPPPAMSSGGLSAVTSPAGLIMSVAAAFVAWALL